MFRILRNMFGGKAGSEVPDPGAFTRAYADALAKAESGFTVEIVNDLELRVTTADGKQSTAFLNNAYDVCVHNPGATDKVIEQFVAASADTALTLEERVDRTRIVPVIKDAAWLQETRQAMLDRGAKELKDNVYEPFSSELVIVYAEDLPRNIRYITPENMEEAGISRDELRVLACANLKRLIPKIERMGSNGLYMLTAGGDYEASLLLLDTIWAGMQAEVQGEVVVAVPTRDLLIVTGSENPGGLKKVREVAMDAWKTGAYRLTPNLFVYRNGKFEEFAPVS